jgi:hypothetical protein
MVRVLRARLGRWRGAVKATTGARSLKAFSGEVRGGAIWLVG